MYFQNLLNNKHGRYSAFVLAGNKVYCCTEGFWGSPRVTIIYHVLIVFIPSIKH